MVPNDERRTSGKTCSRAPPTPVNCLVCNADTGTGDRHRTIGFRSDAETYLRCRRITGSEPDALGDAIAWRWTSRTLGRSRMTAPISPSLESYWQAESIHQRSTFATRYMVSKHVHATVIASLQRYRRDQNRPEDERVAILCRSQGLPSAESDTPICLRTTNCGPRRFDFSSLRDVVTSMPRRSRPTS